MSLLTNIFSIPQTMFSFWTNQGQTATPQDLVPLRPRTLSESKPKNYYDDWNEALKSIPSGYKTTIIIPYNSLTGNYELTNLRIHDLNAESENNTLLGSGDHISEVLRDLEKIKNEPTSAANRYAMILHVD